MKKNISSHTVARPKGTNIVWYLIEHPLSTLTEIAKRDGYLKNTNQTKNELARYVKENIICKVHWWEKTVYFVPETIDCTIMVTVNYLRIKEIVFSKLNQMDFEIPEIKEFMKYYGIKDFTAIPKMAFSKRPIGYEPDLENCREATYQIVLKCLKIIFLKTHLRIIENNHAEKNHINEIRCSSKRQFRESRLFDLFVDLKTFFEKYSFDQPTDFDHQVLIEKAHELDLDYQAAKKFYSDLTHNARHSSYFVSAMTADKMGNKGEFAANNGITMAAMTKTIKKFQNDKGKPDWDLLYRYRIVEDATDPLNTNCDDISWLSYVVEGRDDLNLTRLGDGRESKIKKENVQKRIKRVFPEMQIY